MRAVRAARARLRYASWHLIHLYAYLGVGLALPHQLWTGQDFLSSTAATASADAPWSDRFGEVGLPNAGGNVYAAAVSGSNIYIGGSFSKLSFDAAKLAENVTAFINYVISLKPAAVRGQYIKGITVSATMSPGVRIQA